MSATTGPVVALGAITVINKSVFNDEPMDWRIPIGTGLLAIGANLVERAAPQLAEVLAWTALLTSLMTRIDPGVPAPVESAVAWWKSSKAKSGPSSEEGGRSV
jgi:hypothetical protein